MQFPALRTIGTIYKILGALAGVLTVLALIGVCMGGSVLTQATSTSRFETSAGGIGTVFVAGVILVSGLGAAVTLYGCGELIFLLLAMEENTRATAHGLQQQHRALSAAQPSASATSAPLFRSMP